MTLMILLKLIRQGKNLTEFEFYCNIYIIYNNFPHIKRTKLDHSTTTNYISNALEKTKPSILFIKNAIHQISYYN